ncbi:hypothetical protein HYW75_06410 [Candidatus Pacearchaeota archaeon]|nr:hypothetical protein [Candidatus Pacearchaeota archaeon]
MISELKSNIWNENIRIAKYVYETLRSRYEKEPDNRRLFRDSDELGGLIERTIEMIDFINNPDKLHQHFMHECEATRLAEEFVDRLYFEAELMAELHKINWYSLKLNGVR